MLRIAFTVVCFVAAVLAIDDPYNIPKNEPLCRQKVTSIERLKAAFTAQKTANAQTLSLDQTFCWSYVNTYLDGTVKEKDLVADPSKAVQAQKNASVCLKSDPSAADADVVAAFLEGDVRAEGLFRWLGTKYGFEKNAGVWKNPADRVNSNRNAWGTGRAALEDVPSNWCNSYMREFACHVALPQGIADRTTRPVCFESCGLFMRACNRRQPSDEELSASYNPFRAVNGAQDNGFRDVVPVQGAGAKVENITTIDIPFINMNLCFIWNWGAHAAEAGVGVSHEESGWQTHDHCASWSPASRVWVNHALIALLVFLAFTLF